MEKSIESLSVLFDKIYSAFILRDIAGKIIPGLLLFIPLILLLDLNNEHNLDIILKLNFGLWLLFVILLWIMGYIVQSFGELFGLVTYSLSLKNDSKISPKKYIWSPFIKYYVITLESMLETQKVVYMQEKSNSSTLKYIERLAAIREACGNSGSSLILSLPIYLYYFYATNVDNQTLTFFIIILLVLIFLLIRMHREHSYRYWYALSNIINE